MYCDTCDKHKEYVRLYAIKTWAKTFKIQVKTFTHIFTIKTSFLDNIDCLTRGNFLKQLR